MRTVTVDDRWTAWRAPWDFEAETWRDWLDEIRGFCGVYRIRDASSGEMLYIGESHSHRLYETLLRHFSAWRNNESRTFAREEVQVSVRLCDPHEAAEMQFDALRKWPTRFNVYDGRSR